MLRVKNVSHLAYSRRVNLDGFVESVKNHVSSVQDLLWSRCHHVRVRRIFRSMMSRHLLSFLCRSLDVCTGIHTYSRDVFLSLSVTRLSPPIPVVRALLAFRSWVTTLVQEIIISMEYVPSMVHSFLNTDISSGDSAAKFLLRNFESHSLSQEDISEISYPPEDQLSLILSWLYWSDDEIF